MLSRRLVASAGCALAGLATLAGCGHDPRGTAPREARRSEIVFTDASEALKTTCRRVARAVGYPVPCPMRVPIGLIPTGATGASGCWLPILGAGGVGACSTAWRGWVVGSSHAADEHLVVSASPTPLPDAAHAVNGPAWYPNARIRPLARMRINGWAVRAVFVSPASNDGSAFASHVVLVWTVGRHTYAVGFHDVHGIASTLALDRALVRSIALVGPRARSSRRARR